jgi:hypothetical protein
MIENFKPINVYKDIKNQLQLIDLNRAEIALRSPQTLMLDESYDSFIMGFDLNTSAVAYDLHPLIDEKWNYEDPDTYDLDPISDEWANAYDDQYDILNFEIEDLEEAVGATAIKPILLIH